MTAAHDYFVALSRKGPGVGLGSSMNGHVHFYVCAVDGVFEEVPGETNAQSSPPDIVLHPASAIDETAVVQVQATPRKTHSARLRGPGLTAEL
jgi:hypothetical protein